MLDPIQLACKMRLPGVSVSFGCVPKMYQASGNGRKAAEFEAESWKARRGYGSGGQCIVGNGKDWRLLQGGIRGELGATKGEAM